MKHYFSRFLSAVSGVFLASTFSSTAHATEGGVASWPMGIEIHGAGLFPPPGTYGQLFLGDYRADTIRGDNGERLLDVDLRVNSIVPRFIWVTDQQMFGGQLGFHALVPLNDMRLNIKNGPHDRKTGMGDVHLGPVLGYHIGDNLHIATGIDLVLPTGSYDKRDIINLGTNYYTVQATFAMTYVDPNGFNADLRLMHDYNFENRDTNYTSGREIHADFTAGWGLGNGWIVGVGGHAYQQISDDKCSASNCAQADLVKATHGNRGRTFGVGPAVQYGSKDGWSLSVKWQQEFAVQNRAEGETFWLKYTTAL
jgi:hypothetical protein